MSLEINKKQVAGDHYQAETSPWDLQKSMKSSGNAFVDSRRSDAIRYAWRMKGDKKKLLEDLKKALHCLESGIEALEEDISA